VKKKYKIQAGINWKKWFLSGLILTASGMLLCRESKAAQLPVNLGTAGNYVILSKSGISTVPTSAITGDIGVSPISSTAITGFSLTRSLNGQFATSAQVTGKVYAANYREPTPANLTTAIGNMQTAYTDAAGRTRPNFTELGAGQIGGLTLVAGLYKWSSDVLISSDVTLSGGPNDVWIFQIAGVVALGTTSHFEGIIMSKTLISLATGASVNGRLLAQTAVTLQGNVVTTPGSATTPTLVSAAVATGPYLDAIGQSLNLAANTFTVPLSGGTQFYRIRSGTVVSITGITFTGGNVVITYK
jgi:hypothetical protein